MARGHTAHSSFCFFLLLSVFLMGTAFAANTPINITTANSAITIMQQNLVTNDTSTGQQTPLQFNSFLMASVVALVIILMLLLYLYTKPPIGVSPQPEAPTSKIDYGQ